VINTANNNNNNNNNEFLNRMALQYMRTVIKGVLEKKNIYNNIKIKFII